MYEKILYVVHFAPIFITFSQSYQHFSSNLAFLDDISCLFRTKDVSLH